jgi:hypothetical protein
LIMKSHSSLRPPPLGFQVEGLWSAPGRLDRMLARAPAAFDLVSTSQDASLPADPYLGPYIVSGDARLLIRRKPDEPGLASGDVNPGSPMQQESRLLWLQQVFGLETIDLDIILITLAAEVDLGYELQVSHLQGLAMQRPVSVDLVLNLLCASRDANDGALTVCPPSAAIAQPAGAVDSRIRGAAAALAGALSKAGRIAGPFPVGGALARRPPARVCPHRAARRRSGRAGGRTRPADGRGAA